MKEIYEILDSKDYKIFTKLNKDRPDSKDNERESSYQLFKIMKKFLNEKYDSVLIMPARLLSDEIDYRQEDGLVAYIHLDNSSQYKEESNDFPTFIKFKTGRVTGMNIVNKRSTGNEFMLDWKIDYEIFINKGFRIVKTMKKEKDYREYMIKYLSYFWTKFISGKIDSFIIIDTSLFEKDTRYPYIEENDFLIFERL